MGNNRRPREHPPQVVVVWCRTDMGNNRFQRLDLLPLVVVWCRTDMGNNANAAGNGEWMLWFDVERIWETTRHLHLRSNPTVVVWCRTDTGNNATPLVLISPPVVVWCRTDTGNNDPDDKTVPFQSTDPVRFINYMTGGLVNSCVTSERQVKTPGNTAMYIIPWLTSRTLECIFFHGMRRSCYVTTSIQETWQ